MKVKEILRKLHLCVKLVLVVLASCLLYLAYLPFGLLRAAIDVDGFKGFLDCVDDCAQSVKNWFLRGGVQ